MRKANYIVWFFGFIELILAVLIGIQVYPMLPTQYFWILVAVELVFVVLVLIAVKKTWSSVLMSILAVVLIVLMFVGYRALDKVTDALDKVTDSTSGEHIQMSVVVDTEDPAQTVEDIVGYRVAYLSEEVSEGATATMEKLNAQLDGEVEYVEYEDIVSMVDALLAGEVDALIINEAYLAILEEQEGYEDLFEKIRILTTYEVEGTYHEVEIEIETETEISTEISTETESSGTTTSKPSSGGSSGAIWKPSSGKTGFLGKGDGPSAIEDGTFVVYISGIDTRGNPSVRRNSDVNILAAVNTNTRTVQLINTPRDYYITHPKSKGVKDKLTHAGCYSVECSAGALANLYDVKIDYYVKVNFSGFVEIIDAMGGVDVYSDYEFGGFAKKGYNHFTGGQALRFARDRKSFAAGDNQRGKHQMAVIKGVIDKLASPEWLTNYEEMLTAISGSFVSNFSSQEVYSLIRDQLENPSAWTVHTYAVTGTGARDYTYSIKNLKVYVCVPNYDTVNTAKEKIRAVIGE
ncbi:MAG: LCP family protein [Agathobacter sp.]|nr:LCP family protein [Agathobacter sp.]